jgi:hypothetical protein
MLPTGLAEQNGKRVPEGGKVAPAKQWTGVSLRRDVKLILNAGMRS